MTWPSCCTSRRCPQFLGVWTRRFVEQGGVGSVEIVVMEIEREEGGAVVRGVVRASISPLASDGLDEAFGLAVGLRAIGFGEEMFEAQLVAGGGEEL